MGDFGEKCGAGKSTMIRLISGAEKPNLGKVSRSMSVSWPLAFGDAFQGSLTGRITLSSFVEFMIKILTKRLIL